jgi:hypothetical protein
MTFTPKVKRLMGRPPGRLQDRLLQMRASDKFLRSIDGWRLKQADRPSRAEAIRRLVEQALASKGAARPASKEAASKAVKMAARELEPLGDKSMPLEERDRRKRALIKGPKEFREMRGDQPKIKR